ncbi:MAG TPA: tetratricopeptide repeat protein [Burkholderiales bacterium]|nr:tetratricopeptide repeat protein [Burkholderiales bacterium]
MSLLLEALKKAEKAKEEAQRRSREERPSDEPEELRSEEAPAETAGAEPQAEPRREAAPVLTRDKLPEISQKLEILSDDLDKPAPAAERVEPRREASARASLPPRNEAREEAGRASARKVFEAKFREPNPRMPFYITMGVLGVFGVSTVIYFYIQLRPPPALVNANPPRQAEQQVAAAETAPRPAPVVAPAASGSAIPGLPGNAAVDPAPPAAATPRPTQAPVATSASAQEAPAQKPAPRLAQRLSPTPPPVSAVEPRTAPSVHPKVDSGYSAYLAGNFEAARADYQQALGDDPANRDALLGLAALDVRGGRFEAAEASYLRLLQADPRDAEAQAALVALRGGRVDPLTAESRLKTMLAADPRAHSLNFALGNQFAQQGRWAEAQAQYFKAFAAEPTNPDFAYNLAVSLDHLRQAKQALEYYKHALALARARGASFDLANAEARVAQLTR